MSRTLVVLVTSLLFACGVDFAPEGASPDVTGLSDDALGSSTPVLRFGTQGIQVIGRLEAGGKAKVEYDVERLGQCRGETNTGGPAWTLTGYYRVDGGETKTFWVGGHSPTPRPPPAIIELGQGGELEVWFQVTNRWGCMAWDSDYGRNHRFQVQRPASHPGWVGNLGVNISRSGGGCDATVALGTGYTFGTWARSRAAETLLCFEVWKEGVTDWDNPELWRQLDVQVHFRRDKTAPFESRYVNLEGRKGNNARYAFNVRELDPFNWYSCPAVPFTVSPDGQYAQVTAELYFTVNGREVRPAPGATFTGEYSDYLSSHAHCQP